MADFIDELLRRSEVRTGNPSPESSINALVERLDLTLPTPLRKLWRAGETIALESLDAHLLGYTEIPPYAMPRMVAWFKDLLAGRDPHDRIDHFLVD